MLTRFRLALYQQLQKAIYTRHTDPVQRVFGAVLAIVTLTVMIISVFAAIIAIIVSLPWEVYGIPLLPPMLVALLLIWWLNRRGSALALAVLITISSAVIAAVYEPATYITVAGYPIVHVAFIIPALLATLLAQPLLGYPVLLITVLLLGVRGSWAGYSPEEVRSFVLLATLDLAVLNTFIAIVSFFFRRAIAQHATLAAQLEQRVAERTADLNMLHQSWQVETAQVAHDLNNFMTITSAEMSMFLEDLHDGVDISREEMAAVFTRIVNAQQLQAGLVADLHALSVLKANPAALTLDPVPYDLVERIRAMSDVIRTYAESSRIQIQLNLPEHMLVIADPSRMDRVFMNLVGNAIKFTRGHPNGDGEITVNLNAKGVWAQLEIVDNGIGISADGLLHIGDRWARERRAQLPPGTGLGLNFSMVMVRLFGGDIEVYSRGVNQGTTVHVRLPLVS